MNRTTAVFINTWRAQRQPDEIEEHVELNLIGITLKTLTKGTDTVRRVPVASCLCPAEGAACSKRAPCILMQAGDGRELFADCLALLKRMLQEVLRFVKTA